MLKTAACWLVLAGTLCACARRPVQVRFQNKSAETITHLEVDLLGTAYAFDSLRPGQLTRPVAVKETYYYGYVRAVTRTDTLRYRPIDYVGEKLYSRGQLTIELFIKTGQHRRTGQPVRYLDTDAARGRWLRSFKVW
jgi:hypothetical protein